MKYIVDVNGERIEVGLDADGVHVGDEVLHAHLADVEGTPIHMVTIGREVHRVAVRRGESRGQYALWIGQHRYTVEALDERTRAIRDLTARSSGDKGPGPLIAPMPGLVVRVNVREGEQVVAGQGLVVMEAMKMENELRATSDGTVAAIKVQPGDAVEKGAVLVELGPVGG